MAILYVKQNVLANETPKRVSIKKFKLFKKRLIRLTLPEPSLVMRDNYKNRYLIQILLKTHGGTLTIHFQNC